MSTDIGLNTNSADVPLTKDKEFMQRHGPYFESAPYFLVQDLREIFVDEFAKLTLTLVEVYYVVTLKSKKKEVGKIFTVPVLKTKKVIGKIFTSGGGSHAKEKGLKWVEERLCKDPPDKDCEGGFITVKFYISRSPCLDCTYTLIKFVINNKRSFMSKGYSHPKNLDPLGLVELFFPHGYYQASESFEQSCMEILNLNNGSESGGVMTKCEIIDIAMMKSLTKEPFLHDRIDIDEYKRRYHRASAALRLAENQASAASHVCLKIRFQISCKSYMSGLSNIMSELNIESNSDEHHECHPVGAHAGELTAGVVSTLKEEAEKRPIGEDVFTVAVGLWGFMPYHHTTICGNQYVTTEQFICYKDDTHRVVCLWNCYNKKDIEKVIEVCDGQLTVFYWKKKAGQDCTYGMFGRVQGTSPYSERISSR
eukprot:scaffold197301_cov48-Attheya_sp.AAC.1